MLCACNKKGIVNNDPQQAYAERLTQNSLNAKLDDDQTGEQTATTYITRYWNVFFHWIKIKRTPHGSQTWQIFVSPIISGSAMRASLYLFSSRTFLMCSNHS